MFNDINPSFFIPILELPGICISMVLFFHCCSKTGKVSSW